MKKEPAEKACEICGTIFKTFQKQKAKYCSKKCSSKKYRLSHIEKCSRYHAEYRQRTKHLRWNKEKKRLAASPKAALYKKILSVIGRNVKKGRAWRGNKTFKMLGFSVEELIYRLKSTIPAGYTWQDFIEGKLHIDHEIPHASFNYGSPDDAEFKTCWSLNNLRLLQKELNIKWTKNYESLNGTYKNN
jgi:hypothetical protein